MELRPYQTLIVEQARAAMQAGHKSILICAPTGSGKTALTAHMLKTASSKNMASWFINHRRELIKQSMRAFDKIQLHHGVISSGFIEDYRPLVQVCSISTLVNRYDRSRRPKLIVWDECHHLAAGSWAKIFKAFPDSFHIGLTATPERLDGRGLGDYFKVMIKGPSVAELIRDGWLSPYTVFVPGGVNLSNVHTRMGDYVKSELVAAIDRPTITGNAIREYKKQCDGARAVVFAVSIEHSRHIVAQFNASGVPAVHVDGETPAFERDFAIQRFEKGEIKILSNVDLFGEGFDLPSIECGILLRPTQSLGLYLQQVGRTLRTSEGKTRAIILDHAGNADRHGLPDDPREWSLEGREIRKGKAKLESVKVCTKCFAAQKPGRPSCSFCGFVYEVQARQVDEVEGDLVEFSKEQREAQLQKLRARQSRQYENVRAHTLEDLIRIGQRRGYKRPEMWAKYVFNGRQAKKIRGG